MDVGCADRRTACPRTAKSCGPGAPNAGVKFCRCSKGACEATVANAGSPGRPRISRKPLRREGRCDPACTCGLRALAQSSRAGPPGAAATRPSLLPPIKDGTTTMQSSGETRRENGRTCALSHSTWTIARDTGEASNCGSGYSSTRWRQMSRSVRRPRRRGSHLETAGSGRRRRRSRSRCSQRRQIRRTA